MIILIVMANFVNIFLKLKFCNANFKIHNLEKTELK